MTRAGFLLLSALVLGAAHPAAAEQTYYRQQTVSAEGLGPLRLGMTLAEASESLRQDLQKTAKQYVLDQCHYYVLGDSTNMGDIQVLAIGGIVRRVDVYADNILTDKGVGVTSNALDVEKAYDTKAVRRFSHYGVVQIWVSYPESQSSLVFFTNGSRVLYYVIGNNDAVGDEANCR
ncbi:MAG: hypothetical protein A2V90_01000 [Gammaproteobacteria bacterium RBG_16_57_12]|nr:MAG: hypothetical protein A2V90_01000 [Gammaproteobacteria bacterium RBG_16_57_12]